MRSAVKSITSAMLCSRHVEEKGRRAASAAIAHAADAGADVEEGESEV
jgi:hypothetical protein